MMRKVLLDKDLRNHCIRSPRRRAFSLAELIVAMGVLLLMLSLTGQVMNMTVKSSGQARALTDINQALRVFEQNLRDDLHCIEPGNTIMVIQGNPINAYWTQDGMEADDNGEPGDGYPHPPDPEREHVLTAGSSAGALVMDAPRADMLMFLTTRKATNYVRYSYPGVGGSAQQSVTASRQLVVYGHADLGEYVLDPATSTYELESFAASFPDFPAVSPAVSREWHLARRGLLLLPMGPPPGATPSWAEYETDRFDDPRILRGETDIMAGWSFEAIALTASVASDPSFHLPHLFDTVRGTPLARSQLDETPPPLLADRLGHYFLPNCASFKVEWALDPKSDFVGGRLDGEREILWIDPGRWGDGAKTDLTKGPLASFQQAINDEEPMPTTFDRSNDLGDLMSDKLGTTGTRDYSLAERFAQPDPNVWSAHGLGPIDRPNTTIFVAGRGDPSSADKPFDTPEDVFPALLRITIDLFDDTGRLERPIRYVLVVGVGA